MIRHDALVIGGGLAGLRAAIELKAAGVDVAVLSRVHPLRSHSLAAQGGVNAALNNVPGVDDGPSSHAFDTVKGSDYLADQQAVRIMCEQAPARVREAEHWGCLFSRFDDGRIAQRPFGAAGAPRTCYAADRTGHMLMRALHGRALQLDVTFYDEWFVPALATAEGRIVGLVAIEHATGRVEGFSAGAVILATGGYGRIFARSTNAVINTGSGLALAAEAGAPLRDMEFVQFHPTSLAGTNILITEGARGEGGHLLNADGERFMARYAPNALELASRDVVSRAIQTEIDAGRGFGGDHVHLDLTHLGGELIETRLPGIREIAMNFAGVDPVDEPLPIQPAQHYSMGGVAADVDGQTPVPGLLAAGECACVSVHGANRLGGNSLLDTLVFGQRAGAAAVEVARGARANEPAVEAEVARVNARIAELMSRRDPARPLEVVDPMRSVMSERVGIFRNGPALESAVEALEQLRPVAERVGVRDKGRVFNFDLLSAIEAPMMLDVARTIAASALARTESRGSHARTDFPARDDAHWLRHTHATWAGGAVRLSCAAVDLGEFEPTERTY